jgi:PAS domain S-box-containing protein
MGTWEWDVATGKTVWSEEQYRLLGIEPFSVEPSLEALRRILHPCDADRAEAEVKAAVRERRFFETEYRVIWPNGEVHWLGARARFVYGRNGAIEQMVGVTFDLDRVKRAEQKANEAVARLQTITEATPGTIFTYRVGADDDIQFTYAAPSLRDTHGIEPEELMQHASVLMERVHPDDRQRVFDTSAQSRHTESMWHCQFRHLHPTKGEVWMEVYTTPVRESDGSTVWHGIAHDITHVKHAELALLEAQRRAEAADRAKSEFLANMSHEIRTPMSAIMGYAEILSSHLTDPDDRQTVATIASNGRYLIDIIDDILDLSRIEAGKLDLEPKRVRPDVLVEDVCSLLKIRAFEKGLTLEIEHDEHLPETIYTDPTRLRQILINLIENAIKFTDRGGVTVALRFIAERERLEIDVIDTGSGMSDAAVSQLFRPFTQGDSSVTRRFGGSGLGLSICQRLANMLGGNIDVTTEPGKGSRFTLRIATGNLSGVRLLDRGVERRSIEAPPPRRTLSCRVLVVDDRRDMRHLAQHMLEEAGAEVMVAIDGRDALDRVARAELRGRPFDAILLDMQMPVLDGFAAAAELRRIGYLSPIIALTANAMKEVKDRCLAAGCDAYLSKPLESTKLINTVAHYTQDVSLEELAARRRGPRTEENETSRFKVLFVDDNPDTCKIAKRFFERAGYDVTVARSGPGALEATGRFDSVVLDLGLPGLSGGQVLASLKRRPELERCRFICLSGRGASEVDWRALGFDHFVQKPAKFDELTRLVGPRAAS